MWALHSCCLSPCSFHDWRIDVNSGRTATGAATDAEEDIALTLIFAQHLVDKGESIGSIYLVREWQEGCGWCHALMTYCMEFVWYLGIWEWHQMPSGASYGDRAQQIMDAFWSTGMIADGKYVLPALLTRVCLVLLGTHTNSSFFNSFSVDHASGLLLQALGGEGETL